MRHKIKSRHPVHKSFAPDTQPVDRPHETRHSRINAWLKKHNKPVLGVVIMVVIILGGTISYLFRNLKFASTPVIVVAKKQTPEVIHSQLTGAEVSVADSLRPVTAVMIENSPDARPQSGLKDAGVVFESVAEGGITRFLVLYKETKASTIGPVRSVRPQFASWVAAFDAGLAHVGGSDIPLGKLRSGQIKDLDQFFNAGAYTRVSFRAAPHNVYTTDDKLQALNKSKGYTSSSFTGWKRAKKEAPTSAPTAKTIAVPVSTGLFAVNYSWDQASNTYLRSEGGAPHVDKELGQIAPKVVIVMQVPHDVIKDSNNYSYPDVNTNGKAWVFQNGGVTEIIWSKAGDKEQIKFTDSAGKSVELNPGQTWITAIKPSVTPTWQ